MLLAAYVFRDQETQFDVFRDPETHFDVAVAMWFLIISVKRYIYQNKYIVNNQSSLITSRI